MQDFGVKEEVFELEGVDTHLLKNYEIVDSFEQTPFTIHLRDSFLSLYCRDLGTSISSDFMSGPFQNRLRTTGKKSDLFKAVGGGQKVLDATAGLGQDSVLLARLGNEVTALEQNPVVYLLFQDGLRRFESDLKERIHLIHHNFFNFQVSDKFDVIYIDPMFDMKNRKSKPKKEMQFLEQICGGQDAEDYIEKSKELAPKKTVLKRSDRQAKSEPHRTVMGSTIRFDIYL